MSNISRAPRYRTFAWVITTMLAMQVSTALATSTDFKYRETIPGNNYSLMQSVASGMILPPEDSAKSVNTEFSVKTDSSHRAFYRTLYQLSAAEPALGQALPTFDLNDASLTPNAAGHAHALWANQDGLTQHALDLIALISNSHREGLDPSQFAIGKLKALQGSLDFQQTKNAAERELDQAFHKYAKAIGSGIVDPTTVQKEWDREADSIDSHQLLRQVARGVMTIDTAINSIRPQHRQYASLITMLDKLESLDVSAQVFVNTDKPLKPGADNDGVLQLHRALQASGDMNNRKAASSVYNTDLEMAVQRFQLRHGLETTGLANEKTLRELNTPVGDRIQQVKANLERWRWMPAKLEDSYILINIPEYRVRMVHNEEPLFDMDVVVGKPEHMTPVFSETMKHVVFAPTWTVPGSITNNELLPKERKSPGYLESEEIDFYKRTSKGLKRLPRASVTEEILRQKPFPYTLRQRAGAKNALGNVKFLFPNKHAVYMHDTQAKKLFKRADRAFSHGCVRLSNPDLMAYVVMQLDGYEQSKVNDYIAKTDTTWVNLKTHIPVHMAYFSAWQDENGIMHFRNDIYQQDSLLIKAMEDQQQSDNRIALADSLLPAMSELKPRFEKTEEHRVDQTLAP